jgi:hypothetical protein
MQFFKKKKLSHGNNINHLCFLSFSWIWYLLKRCTSFNNQNICPYHLNWQQQIMNLGCSVLFDLAPTFLCFIASLLIDLSVGIGKTDGWSSFSPVHRQGILTHLLRRGFTFWSCCPFWLIVTFYNHMSVVGNRAAFALQILDIVSPQQWFASPVWWNSDAGPKETPRQTRANGASRLSFPR